MVSKFYSSLSQDLSLVLDDSDDYNVVIVVGKNQDIKEFRAHSHILRSRSPYFKNAFSKKEYQTTFVASTDGLSNNNVMEFKKPNINPSVFKIIIRYMYTGEVDLTNTSSIDILELLVASNELLLKELFKHVQDYLIEKQADWIRKNFVLVLHSVFDLKSFRPYKAIIPNHIYEEIEEYYFKGNLPRITTLPPRIGIIQKIESCIVKPKLSRIIINWIEGKDPNYNRNKKDADYKFDLIYRRSRDGDNIIRNRCAGRGAILILTKVKGSEKIFGGYNPIGWNDNSINYNDGINYGLDDNGLNYRGINYDYYKYGGYSRHNRHNHHNQYNQYLPSAGSFIFSFENNEDIKNMKISRVVNSSCAIYNYLGNGVNFGGGDLALENDRLSLGYTGYYEGLKRNNNEFLTNNHNRGRFEEVEEVEENNYYGNHEVEEIEAFELKLNT
ncbi:unnamed protein product [Rhizophagus irregularis]|nr:unnamed protein product [Rhizophagus irregularis]